MKLVIGLVAIIAGSAQAACEITSNDPEAATECNITYIGVNLAEGHTYFKIDLPQGTCLYKNKMKIDPTDAVADQAFSFAMSLEKDNRLLEKVTWTENSMGACTLDNIQAAAQ